MEAHEYARVSLYVDKAVTFMETNLEHKVKELSQPLSEGTTLKQVEKRGEALEEAKFKLEQLNEIQFRVSALQESDGIQALLETTKDALMALLDKERGHTVTDQQVFEDHARKFEREYFQDMTALGVRELDVVTRVTEYVPQIVDYIRGIIDNGFAYDSNGSVYFDTNAFKGKGHDYRKLVPSGGDTTAEEMAAGEGALPVDEGEKRHPNDFALWKASKAGEPF